ncbi:hypothetical protein [Lonepinella sp. BR2271]|uniref:hypothetical protein n=1 Tax=Lonepinella sp. BR2271 TaxID=3434550 RepID=UPI003F6DAD28
MIYLDIATLPSNVQHAIKQGEPLSIVDKQQNFVTVLAQPSYANGDFNYDLERMKKAVASAKNAVPVPPSALENFESFDEWLKSV